MRRAVISFVLLMFVSPALAEVCDKVVGENWRPADGPTWILNPGASPIVLTEYGAIVLGIFLLAAIQKRWAGYAAGVPVVAIALLVLNELLRPDDVTIAAIREGCLSFTTTGIDICILVAAALALIWFAHRLGPVKVTRS